MEENNVKSRIFHFMEYKGLSQSKFEKAVGLSNGYLNNRALKLVAAAAGISHSLHSHMARSTFATLAISHGARIQNVAKMLGHASVTMTLKFLMISFLNIISIA